LLGASSYLAELDEPALVFLIRFGKVREFAVGEEITGGSEVGVWFYKKGEEPKKRSYLIGFTGIDRAKMLDIPPNSMAMTEGFTVLKENTLIENFQPHFHLRGKAMQVEAILPDGSKQVISYVGNFNFNWMTN